MGTEISPSAVEYTVVSSKLPGRDGVDVPIRDYIPVVETAAAPFLWVHGGGFAGGGLDQKESDAPARFLAATGRRVRTVGYRLVPVPNLIRDRELKPSSNRYPAALHDVVDAATDLAAVSKRRIALGGASAGANLAASAAMFVRDAGTLDLLSLVFAYGAFHSAVPERPDIETQLRGLIPRWMFNPKMARRITLNYVGDQALMGPGYAFPGGGDVHALAPSLLLNAENDRLRASGEAFANDLRAAGVTVSESTIPKATHGFLNARRKPGFDQNMRTVSAWLAAYDAG